MGSSQGHNQLKNIPAENHIWICAREEVCRSSIGAVPRDLLQDHQKSAFELTCDSNATSAINPEVQPSLTQLDRASASIVDHITAESNETLK